MDLLRGLLAEQLREQRAHSGSRRVILELHPHFSTPAAFRVAERYRARVCDLGSIQRAPSDQLVFSFVDDFRIPLHAAFTRPPHNPVRSGASIEHANGFYMLHELREVLEIPPETVHLLTGAVDRNRLIHPDTQFVRNAHVTALAALRCSNAERLIRVAEARNAPANESQRQERERAAGKAFLPYPV